jgi:hypothetical protein
VRLKAAILSRASASLEIQELTGPKGLDVFFVFIIFFFSGHPLLGLVDRQHTLLHSVSLSVSFLFRMPLLQRRGAIEEMLPQGS